MFVFGFECYSQSVVEGADKFFIRIGIRFQTEVWLLVLSQ